MILGIDNNKIIHSMITNETINYNIFLQFFEGIGIIILKYIIKDNINN